MPRHPVLAEAADLAEPERCPQMQWLIERLAFKYQFNLSAAGGCLLLALPDSAERLLIAGLSGERVGLTHCLATAEEHLSCDTDMVFLIEEDELQPVELLHTDAVWAAYVQGMAATDGVQVFDEAGEISLPHFAEYWASTLEQQHWLLSSQRLYV
jgi:hypothetical protein